MTGGTELATRFRELRERAGLTKTALAKPQYTVSYVSQIEAGRRRPSPKALDYFSKQLGVTSDFLTTGVPDGAEETLRYQLEEARRAETEGRFEEAEHLTRLLIGQAEQYGLERVRSLALAVRGRALALLGRVREAIDVYEESLEGDLPERDRGMAAASLGRAYRTVGDLAYAVDLVESYLGQSHEGPLDPEVVAELNTVLVSIYFERGDVFRAERAAGRALAAASRGAPAEIRAKTYWDASRIMAEARRWDEALDYATRARLLLEQMDDKRRVARLHNAYAFICLEVEPPRTEEAASHLDQAESILREAAAPGDMAYVLTERSRLALIEGRPEDAMISAECALATVGSDELEVARCLFLKGRALAAMERRDDARDSLGEAAALFEKHGARQQEAACWRELGELDLAAGNVEAAVEALRAGLRALDPRRSRT